MIQEYRHLCLMVTNKKIKALNLMGKKSTKFKYQTTNNKMWEAYHILGMISTLNLEPHMKKF